MAAAGLLVVTGLSLRGQSRAQSDLRLEPNTAKSMTRVQIWCWGGLGCALIFSLGWAAWLGKQLRRRTRELDLEIAERERAEIGLREKEDFVRNVIDTIPNLIFVKDRAGNFVLVNRSSAEFLGRTTEQLLGKSEAEVNPHPEQVEAFQKDDLEVMDTLREKIVPEEKLTNPEGKTVWLQTVKRPLVSADGKARYVLGVGTDITVRKRQEGYLTSVLQHLPIAVFMKEARNLRFVMWNKHIEELCGVANAEIVGKSDHDFFPKEQADQFVAKDRETLRGGQLVEMEEEILTRHQGTRLLLTRKIPILDEEGRPLYLLGISRDITQSKQAQAELAAERELLRSLMDSSSDSIYFKDNQSRFIRCSKSLCERIGLPQSEIIGKRDFDFFAEEHARAAFEDEREILRSGRPLIAKIEREALKDGRELWALTSKMPLRSKAGEIIGTFGISKDITAMKQAEAKLAETHRQLLETSRLAGMAEVATSVLHNVGNVLNSVNISGSLVAEKVRHSKVAGLARVVALLQEHARDLPGFLSADPKGRQLPGYLAQLSGHLAAEQQELLKELASLGANIEHIKEIVAMQQSHARVGGVRETVGAAELVEDALRLNAGSMDRHQVKVVREYGPAPPVVVERHKVLQILVNLLCNAKHALDERGPGDKRLTLRVGINGEGRVKIAVKDNGVGIAAENLSRIFGHGFTTRKEGHGFGLHSGALAARELGGSLSAQSDGPGLGATFTLEFPAPHTNS